MKKCMRRVTAILLLALCLTSAFVRNDIVQKPGISVLAEEGFPPLEDR